MSLETRSNSALMKRAEQLKRWQDSETCREPLEPRRKSRRIGFSDGCVFLAACAAGDREEVRSLLARGTDIDTANVDGLTALHQACIDDNLDMVEFLVSHGADVNRGDNEGWTPLHATASCGFLSIARFLLDHGANVAAVNNDGELAIDISESDEMEELLQKEVDGQQVNCEEARNREEAAMLSDARDWLNSGKFGDSPHLKTGATALHVAAAKGYIKVMNLLLKGGAELNQQDYDGWTPLHAAAHWAQREACELLADNFVNMDIKNCVGQTPFDVADPDVLRLLEELKKKQNNLQKDNPRIKDLISRPPTNAGLGKGTRSLNTSNNHVDIIRLPNNGSPVNNNANSSILNDRSSITRLSQQDKLQNMKEAAVKETIKEEKVGVTLNDFNESDKESTEASESARVSGKSLDSPVGVIVTDSEGKEQGAPHFLPPEVPQELGVDGGGEKQEEEASAPWRRPGSLRARPTQGSVSGGKLSPSNDEVANTVRRAHSFGSDEKFYAKLDELRQRIRANSMPTLPGGEVGVVGCPPTNHSTSSLPRQEKSRLPCVLESPERPPLPPRPLSMATPQPYSSLTALTTATLPLTTSARQMHLNNLNQSDSGKWARKVSEDVNRQSPDLRPRSIDNLPISSLKQGSAANQPPTAQVRRSSDVSSLSSPGSTSLSPSTMTSPSTGTPSAGTGTGSLSSLPTSPDTLAPQQQQQGITNIFKTFFKSFVPPVRDEEHEIQRKAHAKRVRETRRSTQGVTLEDLKSAEKLVKNKQQAENAVRTSELHGLAGTGATSPPSTPTPPPPGSTATGTTVTASATIGIPGEGGDKSERRPSWRLRIGGDSGDKGKLSLEDSVHEGDVKVGSRLQPSQALQDRRLSARLEPNRGCDGQGAGHGRHSTSGNYSPAHTTASPSSHPHLLMAGGQQGDSEGNTTPTSHPITRKKKPKRRSTGVVNLLEDESEQKSEESADEVGGPGSATPESPGRKGVKNGGEIDYKKVGAWVGRRQPLILSPHHYFSCGRNRKEKIIASRVRSLL